MASAPTHNVRAYLEGDVPLEATVADLAQCSDADLEAALDEVLTAAAGRGEPDSRRAHELLATLPVERIGPRLEARLRRDGDPGARNAARVAMAALVRGGSAHLIHRLDHLVREDEDEDVRIFAATVLGEAGNPVALPTLVEGLRDPNPNVVAAAAEALAALRDDRALEPLCTVLASGHHWARLAAAEALGALGTREAVDPLLAAARDPEASLAAIPALGKIPHPRALAGLAELLEEGVSAHEGEAWRSVARVIASVGPDTIPDALRAMARRSEAVFRSWGPERRSETALLLGLSATPAALDTLLEWAEDEAASDAVAAAIGTLPEAAAGAILERLGEMPDHTLRLALGALRRLPPDADPSPVLECLASTDPEIRAEAAELLATLPVRVLEPAVQRLLERPEHRRGAAEVLARMRPSPHERLTELLLDEDEEVRRTAARGLRACASPAALDSIRAALDRETSRAVVRELLIALARCGGEEAIDDLGRAFEDPDPGMRFVAAEAMGRSRDPRAVAPLLAALSDGHAGVRAAALRALGRLGDPVASEPVADRMRTEEPDLRRVAGESLEHLAPDRVQDSIREAARDPDREVRIIAIDLLARVGDEDSIRIVTELSEADVDSVVRRHAREVVRSLDHG